MIDEFFERKVDAWCEQIPAFFRPHMIRWVHSHVGWRLNLYAATAFKRVRDALGNISSEEKVDIFLREAAEHGDESEAWFGQQLHRFIRLMTRVDEACRRGRFASALLLLALSTLGVCAQPGQMTAVTALAACALFISAAAECGYTPLLGALRQRYLVSTLTRSASMAVLLPGYFLAYVRQGVATNVVLQGTMIIMLLIHVTMQLALVLLNTRQPLILRALSFVAGSVPALTAAAAAALMASLTSRAWPQPAAGVSMALGAMLAFFGQELSTVAHLGGIRLKYHFLWESLMTVGGFLMMIAGAWLYAPL